MSIYIEIRNMADFPPVRCSWKCFSVIGNAIRRIQWR